MRRARFVFYALVLLLGAGLALVRFLGDGSPMAAERWVRGTSAQDQPVAVLLDGEGVPAHYEVSFTTHCPRPVRYDALDVSDPAAGPVISWHGDRLQGTETNDFSVPGGTVNRVVEVSAARSGTSVVGHIRAVDTWELRAQPTTRCLSGSVPFRVSAR